MSSILEALRALEREGGTPAPVETEPPAPPPRRGRALRRMLPALAGAGVLALALAVAWPERAPAPTSPAPVSMAGDDPPLVPAPARPRSVPVARVDDAAERERLDDPPAPSARQVAMGASRARESRPSSAPPPPRTRAQTPVDRPPPVAPGRRETATAARAAAPTAPRREPTAPAAPRGESAAAPAAAPATGLRLVAIRYASAPSGRTAVLALDGREVALHEGESSQGVAVQLILPDRVYVEQHGSVFALGSDR